MEVPVVLACREVAMDAVHDARGRSEVAEDGGVTDGERDELFPLGRLDAQAVDDLPDRVERSCCDRRDGHRCPRRTPAARGA